MAQINITWDEERVPGMLTLEEIKEEAKKISGNIREILTEEMDATDIEITEQYSNFYEVESDGSIL